MRVRDIKRRLAREHGYGADELAKMIDKKELINALSYEEHRVFQKEMDKRKRAALKKSIMVALVCVILVMFRPLIHHAWEVLLVNMQVYTDKKRYEWSRIREYRSLRAAWGFLIMLCINGLQLWLTVSVLISWILPTDIKNRWLDHCYLFPVPYIPIRPAALIATATNGGNPGAVPGGPLAQYGINIGPMLISWLFQYVTGKVELYMGRALSEAHRYQRKHEKRASKASSKRQTRRRTNKGSDADVTKHDNETNDDHDDKTKTVSKTTTKSTDTTQKGERLNVETANASSKENNNSSTETAPLDHVYGAMDELD